MSQKLSLFQELKRRNVFRVVIGYIVLAWLVIQVADVVLNNIAAPPWVFLALMFFLSLGLVFSTFFSWAFEMTPEGLKRESEVDRSQSITHQTGKKLDRMVMGILVLALAYFMLDKFVLSAGREDAAVEAALQQASEPAGQDTSAEQGGTPDNTIAVLPFVNMSSDPEQEYFSDGLSEELLNLLAKIPELNVASRSSAFQFKGEKIDLTEVAHKLNVAHVLEGSVRKAGNQIRITAQLIRADNGYHMWSETYDRSLDNIFAIQDEISAAVVDALKIELLGEAPKSQVVDPEAYALWLKGRYIFGKWGKDNFEKAIEALNQALEIDPDYAQAWASLSVAYMMQTNSGYRSTEQGLALARDAIDNALAINPEMPEVLARLALVQSFEWDWEGAKVSLDRALSLAPDSIYALGAAGSYYGRIGNFEKGREYYQRIAELEPLQLVNMYNTANSLHVLGRLEEAERAYRLLLEINPEDWGSHTQVAVIMLRQGRADEAWEELKLEVDPQQQEFGRLLALHSLGRDVELNERLAAFIEQHQSWASVPIAEVYAWSGDHVEAFNWLSRAVEARDTLVSAILGEPVLNVLHDDPRWDALLTEIGLLAYQ